ncbi:transient receptor potential channel pyrexia-like [Daphnia carinata]|uniref:transient receptor potential channel pyrexia-like n=1 Tax=Daphnia carinata TaxID=120202 RepID=UPI00257BBB7E|nr:transient receptor potential channel pyrexia-like [Daphnia carinata]
MLSIRKLSKKDPAGQVESGDYSNDAFIKDEGPPTGDNEREIENYRRSTIKKTSSNIYGAFQFRESSEDDDKEVNQRSSLRKGKNQPYHRQHCAKRKFKDGHRHKHRKSSKTKKKAEDDEMENQTGHRLKRAFSISSESNTSHTELQGIDHKENFTSMPWHNGCSIWLQQMLAAAIEDMINTKEASVIRLSKTFSDDLADESVWHAMPVECRDIGILVAALKGNVVMLRCFLALGGDANATDMVGRSALHYAASSSSADAALCLEILIEHGAIVDTWDLNGEATPLICASASGRIELVEVLLKAGANVNAGLSDSKNLDGTTPLVWAVRARSLVCATRLIEAGAAVNSIQVYSESPIHVAAVQGDVNCLKLLLDNHADVRVLYGAERRNPLHLAAFEGNVDCIRMLLHASKAQVNAKDSLGRTPLHLAALSQSVDSVEELLDNGAEIDICDEMQETPLHSAVVKTRQSIDVVKLLILKGADVNAKDQFGQTPLHIAAFNENSKLATLLIHSGADLSAKNRGKMSALASVVRRVPDALSAIPRTFDSAIQIVDNDPADPDCQLRLDLRVLVPAGNQKQVGEMGLLTALIAAEQRHILQHPVIGAFLHLKWMKIRSIFIGSLIFQFFYVLFLTLIIHSIFVVDVNAPQANSTHLNVSLANLTDVNDKLAKNATEQFKSWPESWNAALWWLTVVVGSATGCKEIFQLYCNPNEYIRDPENYGQIISVVGMVLSLLMPHPDHTPQGDGSDWQHHLAAIVVVVAWINLMMHVGRFPVFGLYVQMFTTVAQNIGKLLVAYVSLIVGFAMGFAVLFPKSQPFSHMPYALVTAFVMMAGESDYSKIFYEAEEGIKYSGTTHLVFLVFILLISVVLMNLIVGLAVSDIQGLQKSARLDRLVRLTKQIARMESFIFFPWPIHFSSLWSKFPKRESIRRHVLVVSPKTKRNYNFRPNDPRDHHFPADIKESLLKIVVQRVAKKKKGTLTSNVPIMRTVTTQKMDDINEELYNAVLNRVEELFHNYMSQIVVMNTNIEEQLTRMATRPTWSSTRSWQQRPSCDCSMIHEESFIRKRAYSITAESLA